MPIKFPGEDEIQMNFFAGNSLYKAETRFLTIINIIKPNVYCIVTYSTSRKK